MKKERLAVEIVAPLLAFIVFILFAVMEHIPQSKEKEDAVPFHQDLQHGDWAYMDIVSIIEPEPIGESLFLCRCTDPEGDTCMIKMPYSVYKEYFGDLFRVQLLARDYFVYAADGTVRVYGEVKNTHWQQSSWIGKVVLEAEFMELLP